MPEPTVSQLIAQIDTRLAELAERDAHLEKTERGIVEQRGEIRQQRARLEGAKAVAQTMIMTFELGDLPESPEPPPPAAARVAPPTIIDAAMAYLAEVGGESDLKTMTLALLRRGQLRGAKPDRTLSTQLYRATDKVPPRVHKVDRGRWALGPAVSPAWRSDVMDRLREANQERHQIQAQIALEVPERNLEAG